MSPQTSVWEIQIHKEAVVCIRATYFGCVFVFFVVVILNVVILRKTKPNWFVAFIQMFSI